MKESNLQPNISYRSKAAEIGLTSPCRTPLGKPEICRTPSESRHASDNETATRSNARRLSALSRVQTPRGWVLPSKAECDFCGAPSVNEIKNVKLCLHHDELVSEIAADSAGWSGRKPECQPFSLRRATA